MNSNINRAILWQKPDFDSPKGLHFDDLKMKEIFKNMSEKIKVFKSFEDFLKKCQEGSIIQVQPQDYNIENFKDAKDFTPEEIAEFKLMINSLRLPRAIDIPIVLAMKGKKYLLSDNYLVNFVKSSNIDLFVWEVTIS